MKSIEFLLIFLSFPLFSQNIKEHQKPLDSALVLNYNPKDFNALKDHYNGTQAYTIPQVNSKDSVKYYILIAKTKENVIDMPNAFIGRNSSNTKKNKTIPPPNNKNKP